MAEGQVISNNFTSGISIDKYFPLKNSCANAKGVNLFSSRRVCLSTHNSNNIVSLPSTSEPTTIGDIITCNDGNIYDLEWSLVYDLDNTSGYTNVRNYIDHTVNGTNYRYLIATKYLHRYLPDAIMTYYGIEDGAFGDAWWTESGWRIIHGAGYTGTYTGVYTLDVWVKYNLKFNAIVTAGSFTIKVWGSAEQTISASGDYSFVLESSTTAGVVLTPTTTFIGSINSDNVLWIPSMEQWVIELTNSSQLAPAIQYWWEIFIGNWNIVVWIDMFWIKYDALVLPKAQQIVEITHNWEYMLLWTRDSKNTYIHFWDWVSENILLTKKWNKEILQSVEDKWDFCIAITGSNIQTKRIWKTDGNSRVEINNTKYGAWSDDNESYTAEYPAIPISYDWDIDSNGNSDSSNMMSVLGDMIFMPGKDSVIVYGRTNPLLNYAFVNAYPIKNCDYIYCIHSENEKLYVWYDDNELWPSIITFTITNLEELDNADTDYQYWKRWHIELLPIIWVVWQQKISSRLKFGYKTPTSTYIAVLYRENGEKNRITFMVDTSVNPIEIMPTEGSVYRMGSTDRLTIKKVITVWNITYIECEQTISSLLLFDHETISRVSWTGSSPITFVDKFWYRLFDTISPTEEISSRIRERVLPSSYSELQVACVLHTDNQNVTPEINDSILSYEVV